MKHSLTAKFASLFLVLAALSLVTWLIRGVIQDRQRHKAVAVNSVAKAWGGAQILEGPLIARQCPVLYTQPAGADGSPPKQIMKDVVDYFLPEQLTISGDVQVESRRRGIYDAFPYTYKATAKAKFNPPAAATRSDASAAASACSWQLVLGLSDQRGLRQLKARLAGEALAMESGSGYLKREGGAHMPLKRASLDAPFELDLDMEVAGTSLLSWLPNAKGIEVQVKTNWPHWSYDGSLLPSAQESSAAGSTASWKSAGYFGSSMLDEGTLTSRRAGCSKPVYAGHTCDSNGLDMRLIEPIDQYALNDRASKYALLFIALTFATVFAFEAVARRRVHPVQYGFLGLGLSIFFLLLLSLGEFLGFGVAYLSAASACTVLLTLYGFWVLGGAGRAATFGVLIAGLYGAMYAILNLEHAALLIGSVLLFAVLASVMLATRRIDWHELSPSKGEAGAAA